ncbi:MAG: NAD(P)-dependent oxidoreductase [Alphaproteobacteria bacterium]
MGTGKMLTFTDQGRAMPDKRDEEERRDDFGEIYAEYAASKAAEQASRCSQCGIPFCQDHCPLTNNIPDWLKLTAEGRLEEAYHLSAATNTFPEICGRICPQDRLCEGSCVIEQADFGTVTIGAVERYITETAFDNGWVRPRLPTSDRAQSIGIIGSGPAGLAAAEQLRATGFNVTIYERNDRIGGLLIYGIPNFKLDKAVVSRREALLREQGIDFRTNVQIGRDISFADLRARHDALLIATGVYKARDLSAPGSGLAGIIPALDYLIASNRKGLGDAVPEFEDGTLDAKGKKVVVIGGGDTAMDCVRTAIRQGADAVTCLYRRDRANMPGSAREVHNATEEGVQFRWLAAPEGFAGDTAISGVIARRMTLGAPDAEGRRTPTPLEDGRIDLEADLVIKALGFMPEDLPTLWGEPDLAVSRWGSIMADPITGQTSIPGVFAAGDIVRGASLVVWAIKDGRSAATAITQWLEQTSRVAAE